MQFNPEIFRAYDIRGVYGSDFDDEFAFNLGLAFVKFTNRRSFLVGNDEREFSPEIAEALIRGMNEAGADVEYIGQSTTPFFNFILGKRKSSGGVMITASHNPPEYAGFKLFDENGAAIYGNKLNGLKSMLSQELAINRSGGQRIDLNKTELLSDYTDFIIKKSGVCKTQLLGVRFEILENKIINEEVANLSKKMGLKDNGSVVDVYFSFDGDADRLVVMGGDKAKIPNDLVVGLLVKDAIGFWGKPVVVYDQRFSRGVTEKFNEWRVKSFESRIGRTFVREEMIDKNADLGGELSGHIFFKEANYNEMPLLAILRILKILAKSGKKIEEMVEPFRTWANSGEININFQSPISNFQNLRAQLKEKYKDGEIAEGDGITVKYPDWWFNLRPSNTEPVLRLVVEAKTKQLLDEKKDELQKMGL